MKSMYYVLVGSLAASASIFAQSPMVVFAPAERATLPLATPQDGVTVAGNFDGNFLADSVSIVGGSLRFTHDLQFDRSVVSLPIAANDVSRRRVSNQSDEFVSVGASGLVVGRWDNEATYIGNNWEGLVQNTVSTSSDWTGATLVRCADLDGDGDEDVVALTAGGTKLISAMADSSGLTEGPTHILTNAADRIATLRFPGSSFHVVACAGIAGTVAIQIGGGAATSLALPPAQYRDLVGMEFGGTSWLAGIANPEVPSPYDTGTVHYVSWTGEYGALPLSFLDSPTLAAGDFNGDSLPDLCLNSKVAGELVVVLNRSPATPAFSYADPTALLLVVPSLYDEVAADWIPTSLLPDPTRSASLALFDIDQDEDLDIVFSDGPTGKLLAMRNPLTGNPTEAVPFPGAPNLSGYFVNCELSYEGETATGVLATVLFDSTVPLTMSHLEVAIWSMTGEEVVPDAVYSKKIPHGSPLGYPSTVAVEVQLPEIPTTEGDFGTYLIRARFVAVDGSGFVVGTGPASLLTCNFPDLELSFAGDPGPDSTPISGDGVVPRPGGGGSTGPTTP